MIDASPAAPHRAAELRRGGAVVRTAIAQGAPIESLWQGDVDWCAAGAWREDAPLLAVGAPEVAVRATGGEESITAAWRDGAAPTAFSRTLRLDRDGALLLHYERALSRETSRPHAWRLSMPVLWDAAVRLELPAGARARVAASWGEGLPAAGSEFVWPSLSMAKRTLDLSQPTTMVRGAGVLCLVELPRGKFVVRTSAGRLEVGGTPGVVTHARVLIEHDAPLEGRTPPRWWQRRPSHRQIVVGPSVGAPDTLQWDLTIRGTSLASSV